MQGFFVNQEERARLERVAAGRAGLWWALALEILGLAGFVLLFNFLLPNLGTTLSTPARVGIGLLFSLVPSMLWLLVFYAIDHREPEPKAMVLGVFLFGALLYAALHEPVLQGFFGVDGWLYRTQWSRILGGILVVGVVEQALVFLAVRVLVFGHPEFDERVDGVIYAVAAGLGMATVINFGYVVERGGVNLDVGSVRMVVNALAFGSIAGVQGYFLGQAKFERVPVWYLPAGLALAALLNGLLFVALESRGGSLAAGTPWDDLLLAGGVAVAALVMVFWLIARANEETLRVARGEAPASRPETAGPLPQPVMLPIAAAAEPPEPAETQAAAELAAEPSADAIIPDSTPARDDDAGVDEEGVVNIEEPAPETAPESSEPELHADEPSTPSEGGQEA